MAEHTAISDHIPPTDAELIEWQRWPSTGHVQRLVTEVLQLRDARRERKHTLSTAFGIFDRLRKRLEAQNAHLRELLRQVEWASYDRDNFSGECPVCGYDEPDGHAPDCKLDAALKESP